ncbi:hypothetical protein K504DRAFT_225969 [Pleomassaria siparia CBS 279.74]|uniref:Uncharacterized protein n=1 Tax=Pleomassaria siparia CBS 279.74 TaxID=1314801 RepID=A0A6G1KFM1_9PLEO|nr:hypothetical protein K504DRAFT_225969 [Pleomassaria siparia CBS 279.74]
MNLEIHLKCTRSSRSRVECLATVQQISPVPLRPHPRVYHAETFYHCTNCMHCPS